MPNLDRFPLPPAVSPIRGIRDYCEQCGQPVLGQNVKCVECQAQDWLDTVRNMSTTEIFDEMDSIFEGNEKSFRWDDGMMELTYLGNPAEVEKGKMLMLAHGTVKNIATEEALHIYLTSYKDELAIY